MICDSCGGKTDVLDSRMRRDKAQQNYTYRRRECPTCKRRFSTAEYETGKPVVYKCFVTLEEMKLIEQRRGGVKWLSKL